MRPSLFVLAALACALAMSGGAVPAGAQEPCAANEAIAGEAQVAHQAEVLNSMWAKLLNAYEQGDKKEEEALVKQFLGYVNHRQADFSKDDQGKMEELAQRPEIKAVVETLYVERRAEEIERAHSVNLSPCFFYPNPMLQDYVNKLGQTLVPSASTQYYAFRIVNDPRPDAWAMSTGSVYITTGLLAMIDNEAQLSYVLAHEIGHVEHRHMYAQTRGEVLEQFLEVEKIRSIRKKGMIIGAIATGVGAAIGGAKGGGSGAVFGAALGYAGTALVTSIVENLHRPKFTDWSDVQENDADDFAAHDTLEHNFDVREAPKVFVTLENTIHRDDKVGMGFHYGHLLNLAQRRLHVQNMLAVALKADLEARSKTGLQTGSPNFALLMAEVKRDNGALALEYDLFDEARQNLEEAIALRSSDPTAHLYLGRAYKLTARNPDDEKRAVDQFLLSIHLDTGRNAYALPHLEHALALLKSNDPTHLPEAQREIKTYIELYKLNYGGRVPDNMPILYDYLSLTGDENWAQQPVTNVAQATGTANEAVQLRGVNASEKDNDKPRETPALPRNRKPAHP